MKLIRIGTLMLLVVSFIITSVYLGYKILDIKKSAVLGVQYVTNLQKDNYLISESKDLKSFYEPVPNTINTTSEDWLDYEVKIMINNDGLNDRFDYDIHKRPGLFRIITLGDSHTYGVYVETSQNYPEVLEDLLNDKTTCNNVDKFEVINLGVPGYDVRFAFERFKQRGLKYNPDVVLWLVNNWNLKNIAEYFYPRFDELRKQGLSEFDAESGNYDIPNKIFKEIKDLYGLKNVLEYQRNIFQDMSKLFSGSVVIISSNNIHNEYSSFLENITHQIPMYSYYGGITDIYSDELLKFPDHHPNSTGHKTIASDVFVYLQREVLKDC